MQDRYLFRGKRVDSYNKEWVQGNYVSVPRPMIVLEELQLNGSWYWFEVNPDTVGRCTGLHAAKSYRGESEQDRLIFEGDILNGIPKGEKSPWEIPPAIVRFGENSSYRNSIAGFTMEHLDGRSYTNYPRAKELEIIGNIHDMKIEVGQG